MASSNPFRKSVLQPKGAEATLRALDPIETTQTHAAPPRTSFREPEPDADTPDEEPEPEQQQEQPRRVSKPVKKVRVLTPPPLSPDSPEWPEVEPMYQTGGSGLLPLPVDYDPFGGSATDDSDRDGAATPPSFLKQSAGGPVAAAAPAAAAAAAVSGGPPGNPFSRTLHDIEKGVDKQELEMELQKREEGEVLKAANSGSGAPALNVDAFKRLLLTGNPGLQGGQTPSDDSSLASYNAETNKTPAPVDGAYETGPLNSNRSMQGQRTVSPSNITRDKKSLPPPPPSSRHGRTIKSEQPKGVPPPASGTYISPAVSYPHSGDELESASDEESSTDVSLREAAAAASGAKKQKPAPAPPPRRGHTRTDTKTNISGNQQPASLKPTDDDQETRSSMESAHKQETVSDKHRANIPAPPPRRRPHATPKQGVTGPSPSVSSSSIPQRNQQASSAEPTPSPAAKAGKSPAPPLPPARNSSILRRPPSFHAGAEGPGTLSRRDSAPKPPPPPPRHHRGSSPSMAAAQLAVDNGSSQIDTGKGADILADLDALRREVEALRGSAQ